MKIRGDIRNFCVYTGDKLFTGINDTGNNRHHCCTYRQKLVGVVDTGEYAFIL
jgi:hypothetical protein